MTTGSSRSTVHRCMTTKNTSRMVWCHWQRGTAGRHLHQCKTTKITLRMVPTYRCQWQREAAGLPRGTVRDDDEEHIKNGTYRCQWQRGAEGRHRGMTTTKSKLIMVRTVVNDNGEQQVFIEVWRRRTHQELYGTVYYGEQQVCTSREDDKYSDVWTY